MLVTQSSILQRHRETLHGTLRLHRLPSAALGLSKPFYVYTPPEPATALLWLFRGHEREYVNFNEDTSRRRTTAIEDLDRQIHAGTLPPVMAILPGLNSANNHVPSLGVDMAGTWSVAMRGLGTGRFWHFLTDELIPHVEGRFGVDGPRLAAGFSLGGFTVSLLAARHPGYFDHAGMYDALFMWPRHHDPRVRRKDAYTDPVWMEHMIFDAALGRPRDRAALDAWNPTDLLTGATDQDLAAMKNTTWWIKCASGDGSSGNRDRAYGFVRMLRKKNFPLGFDDVLLHPEATHSWHWNDQFVTAFVRDALNTSEKPRT